MSLTNFLKWGQRLSMLFFLFSVFYTFAFSKLMEGLLASIFFLYTFVGIAYVNHMKKNGANEDKVTLQICVVVLGTVLLIVLEAMIFKFFGVLKHF